MVLALNIISYICVTIMILGLLALIKNCVTYRQQSLISDAIFRYHIDCIEHHIYEYEVGYDDMRGYVKTILRFWDWGYKHILPRDKFEIVKPYINKKHVIKAEDFGYED